MNDQQTYDPIDDLIMRYLSGNVTEREIAELESWVREDPEHKTQFMQARRAWILGGMVDRKSRIDVDAAWDQLAQATSSSKPRQVVRMNASRKLWRIAAAVAFLLVAGTILYQQMQPGDTRYLAQQSSLDITLDDGTLVTLNRNSELIWLTDDKGKRNVSLKGDAFFDVAKNVEKPFVVSTPDLEVTVLGTAFYVDARPEQPTAEVTVEHGRVSVKHLAEEVVLSAEEKATFSKADGTLQKLVNSDPNFASVKTRTLRFRNSKMAEVVATLNRHYHARIIAEPQVIKTCELTSTFENKPLEATLQIIASTLNLEIINQNQYIILRGSCTLN